MIFNRTVGTYYYFHCILILVKYSANICIRYLHVITGILNYLLTSSQNESPNSGTISAQFFHRARNYSKTTLIIKSYSTFLTTEQILSLMPIQ